MEIFMTFILPIIITAVIAVLFGFLLAYLGKKFEVKEDPKIAEVTRLLSGANCGGCGYAGCSGFAKALVEGKANLSSCNATSKANKAQIATVLGVQSSDVETVAVVHCSGGNNCDNKYSYQGYGNCLTAQLLAGGSKACEYGCMGLGSCISACNYQAISESKDGGYNTINPDKCISCGACISACPKGIIGRIPKNAKVYLACSSHCRGKEVTTVCKSGCIGCGLCAKNCPAHAITMVDNMPVIDYSKCINCGLCATKCPRKCIKVRY